MRNLLDQIVAYESGDLDFDESLDLFQHLVDNGTAWLLQGSYGRTATLLLREGLILDPLRRDNA